MTARYPLTATRVDALAFALLLLIPVAGCGGDAEEDESSAPAAESPPLVDGTYVRVPAWDGCPEGPVQREAGAHATFRHCVHEVTGGAHAGSSVERFVYDEQGNLRRRTRTIHRDPVVSGEVVTPQAPMPGGWETWDYHPNGSIQHHHREFRRTVNDSIHDERGNALRVLSVIGDATSIHTSTYDADDHEMRREIDRDGDGVTDEIVTNLWAPPSNRFGSEVSTAEYRVRRAAIDTDADGTVDRHEFFMYGARGPDEPDLTLIDEDLDGVAERIEGADTWDRTRCARDWGSWAAPRISAYRLEIASLFERPECTCLTPADRRACAS